MRHITTFDLIAISVPPAIFLGLILKILWKTWKMPPEERQRRLKELEDQEDDIY